MGVGTVEAGEDPTVGEKAPARLALRAGIGKGTSFQGSFPAVRHSPVCLRSGRIPRALRQVLRPPDLPPGRSRNRARHGPGAVSPNSLKKHLHPFVEQPLELLNFPLAQKTVHDRNYLLRK